MTPEATQRAPPPPSCWACSDSSRRGPPLPRRCCCCCCCLERCACCACCCSCGLACAACQQHWPTGMGAPHCLQGLAMGGEYGAAIVYVSEMAGVKHRATLVAVVQARPPALPAIAGRRAPAAYDGVPCPLHLVEAPARPPARRAPSTSACCWRWRWSWCCRPPSQTVRRGGGAAGGGRDGGAAAKGSRAAGPCRAAAPSRASCHSHFCGSSLSHCRGHARVGLAHPVPARVPHRPAGWAAAGAF